MLGYRGEAAALARAPVTGHSLAPVQNLNRLARDARFQCVTSDWGTL